MGSTDLYESKRLADIYSNPDDARYRNLMEKFTAKYEVEPELLVRAPGRINIIGEHVDYCGFPVLPMAIEQDILIGASISNTRELRVSNTDSSYDDFAIRVNSVAVKEVKWYSYVLAGFLGIAERINSYCSGINIMLDGRVPMSAGLSSSSALVCASALVSAILLKDTTLTREKIAELCAKAERHVGTQGGGMDQAISFLGVRDRAQLINFNPLRPAPVQLPSTVAFVVSNTLVNKWKADGTDFNNRVADCRLGCRVIACRSGIDWRSVKTYSDLVNSLSWSPEDLVAGVEKHLNKTPYTKEDISGILDCSDEEFKEVVGKSSNTKFHLYRRGLHVAKEWSRTIQFHQLCTVDNPDVGKLGELINESHYSLRDLYDVSIEELDELTEICRKSGALGSRLVGAGFGGCSISMIPKGAEMSFMKEVYDRYYKPRDLKFDDVFGKALFASTAGTGACVVDKASL